MATQNSDTPDKKNPVPILSYKNSEELRKFMDDRGKIVPSSKSGLTSKQQRLVTREIKRARHLGLLPSIQNSR